MMPRTVLVTISLLQTAYSLFLGQCDSPLGMESGAIPDRDISASSAYDSGSVGAHHGRLRNDKQGGAWCPRHMVTQEAREFLEIDLHQVYALSATRTQGRYGNGQGQEYAEEFYLDYWRPGFSKWRRWQSFAAKSVLPGNVDTSTVVEQNLQPALIASRVRFVPFTVHVRTVCLRVELVGCLWTEGVVSYSMPQGALRGSEMDLRDRSYDGREENGQLSGGLGQLVDGLRGYDTFRMDLEASPKGFGWVGWRNDTPGHLGHPVEIIFEFDYVRNFSAMYLYTNNLYSKDIQVFSHAKVYFSVGGRHFTGEPVHFSYMPDLVMEHARNVTVKLHQRLGRFIKLQLYFAARWILLSEVSFESVTVSGNVTEEAEIVNVVEPIREDPPQRDEVHTTPTRDQQKKVVAPAPQSPKPESESRQLLGLVIGMLLAVIVLLMGAIAFVVVRNRKLKSAVAHPVLGRPFATDKSLNLNMKDLQMRVNVNANGHVYGQLSLDDPEKGALYHEPFRSIEYSHPVSSDTLRHKEYDDHYQIGASKRLAHDLTLPLNVAPPLYPRSTSATSPLYHPSVTAQSPHYPPSISGHSPLYPPPASVPSPHYPHSTTTPSRPLPPLQDLFPKPPPIPPPPEQYYATTDICTNPPPPVPVSTPPEATLSAGSHSPSSIYGHLSHPPCRRLPILHLPSKYLVLGQPLGQGRFGEVHMGEITELPEGWKGICDCTTVAIRRLKLGASESTRREFISEVESLWRLRDHHLAQVVAAELSQEPLYFVVEYSPLGDLNQFLQDHVADTTAHLPPTAKTLSYGCLIYLATQIASGMKYLESMKFVHRDLATRNCLVGRGYSVKISDLGLGRSLYSGDYFDLDGRETLPIRWMAWETVLLGKFSSKSDVWSFAITLWEILTFAREQPFEEFGDEKVIDNLSHFYQHDGLQTYLPQPFNCPKEIYDLMLECWQREEVSRPNFREIHLFLQRKNLGYSPDMD